MSNPQGEQFNIEPVASAEQHAANSQALACADNVRADNGLTPIGSTAADTRNGVCQADILAQLGLDKWTLDTRANGPSNPETDSANRPAQVELRNSAQVPIKILPPGPYVPTWPHIGVGGGTRIGPGSTWKGPYSGPSPK